ncbi:hypothetical protein [Herbiconiux liukaitaii]|uniref:hypothetical protein n=1 Tax=Herbiconiux liukaitaii TaxID=3342799 RepID=UPI0035BA5E63
MSYSTETVSFERELADVVGADGRDRLLTEGVFEVIEFLTGAARTAPEGAAVVSLVVTASPASAPTTEAYIEAVRGLVQSFTLERDPSTPAVNIVVSGPGQEQDRAATLAYLSSVDGRFSRGTTYDLRETAR